MRRERKTTRHLRPTLFIPPSLSRGAIPRGARPRRGTPPTGPLRKRPTTCGRASLPRKRRGGRGTPRSRVPLTAHTRARNGGEKEGGRETERHQEHAAERIQSHTGQVPSNQGTRAPLPLVQPPHDRTVQPALRHRRGPAQHAPYDSQRHADADAAGASQPHGRRDSGNGGRPGLREPRGADRNRSQVRRLEEPAHEESGTGGRPGSIPPAFPQPAVSTP